MILILCHEMHVKLQIEKFRKNLKEPTIRLKWARTYNNIPSHSLHYLECGNVVFFFLTGPRERTLPSHLS